MDDLIPVQIVFVRCRVGAAADETGAGNDCFARVDADDKKICVVEME